MARRPAVYPIRQARSVAAAVVRLAVVVQFVRVVYVIVDIDTLLFINILKLFWL